MELVPPLPLMPAPFTKRKPGVLLELTDGLHHRHRNWHRDAAAHGRLMAKFEAEIEARREAMRIQNAQLYELSRKNGIMICPVTGKGGGAKTTTATTVAARIAMAIHMPVILYDANPDSPGAAIRSGIDPRSTLKLSEFYGLCQSIEFSDLAGRLATSQHGVMVIAGERKISPEHTREMLVALRRYSRVIVVDLGTNTSGDLNNVVHELSDVFLFPMLTTSGTETANGPVDERINTQQSLIEESREDPGDPYNLVALKAQMGLTVAIGAEEGEDLGPFRRKIGMHNRLLPVPYDEPAQKMRPLWLPTHNEPLPGEPDMLSVSSAIAWGNVSIESYKIAADIRMHADMRRSQPTPTPPKAPDAEGPTASTSTGNPAV